MFTKVTVWHIVWSPAWFENSALVLSSSVKPWLVCTPVGEPTPHQQEPKLQWLTLPTNNNWGDGWLHRVIRQSHPLWPLVRGACGAAYSCVAPSGNPRLKKGGSGGDVQLFYVQIFLRKVRSFILLDGWFVLTPHHGFLSRSPVTFGPILWIKVLPVEKLELPAEHLFWPPPPILSILAAQLRREGGKAGGRLP